MVPLSGDQHPIGHLSPGGAYPSFGVCVRARAARRDLYHLDPRVGENRVECGGELPGPVPDQEPEPAGVRPQVHQQVPRLLHRPRAVRVRRDAEDMPWRVSTSITKNTYKRRKVTAQSTWKKSHGSVVDAWARRNCRQLERLRCGAGGMRSRFSTRHMVEAATRMPRPSRSPWIRR